MQEAVDEIALADSGQASAVEILAGAERLAFRRTGWDVELSRHERACADEFTRQLRALDGLDVGTFAARHEELVAQRDRCSKAAR